MKLEEKTLSSNRLYKGKILSLRKDRVLLPNGKEADREIVEHSGGSAVLCVKGEKIFLVKQFRYPYEEEILEIPAGKINDGETPEEAVARELKEEAGIIPGKLVKIFEIYPSPGYTDEKIYIFRAEANAEGEMNLDEDEFLVGGWYDKSEVKEMVRKGVIKDAKTVIAILAER